MKVIGYRIVGYVEGMDVLGDWKGKIWWFFFFFSLEIYEGFIFRSLYNVACKYKVY